MATVAEVLEDAWKLRVGPVILATVDADGVPNVIYVKCVGLYGQDRLVIADNYMDKTRRNILTGSKGAALFMTQDSRAYQVKGTFEYHHSGPIFDAMRTWNPPRHPGRAAVALVVREVYTGATRLAP